MSRRVRDRVEELEQGRDAYAKRAWLEAHDALTVVHEREGLAPEDLELLSVCAFMLGRDDETIAWLERAHQRFLEAGEEQRAAHSAVGIGLNLASRGQIGPDSLCQVRGFGRQSVSSRLALGVESRRKIPHATGQGRHRPAARMEQR